jgi:hypothetical protein
MMAVFHTNFTKLLKTSLRALALVQAGSTPPQELNVVFDIWVVNGMH